MLSTSKTNVMASISTIIFIQGTSFRRQDPTSPDIRIAENARSACRRLKVRFSFLSTRFDKIRFGVNDYEIHECLVPGRVHLPDRIRLVTVRWSKPFSVHCPTSRCTPSPSPACHLLHERPLGKERPGFSCATDL
jgi:hypothetical protein